MGRYVPPELEGVQTANQASGKGHALGARARRLGPGGTGELTVRFEMPFGVWCRHCAERRGGQDRDGTLIHQGVRFNALKKQVGKYYSTPVYRFRLRHGECGGTIELRTDPAQTAYVVTEGGRRFDEGIGKGTYVDEDGEIALRLPEDPFAIATAGGLGRAAAANAADPFSRAAAAASDKATLNCDQRRTAALLQLRARDWEDPYARSKMLRSRFRMERKLISAAAVADDDLKRRMGLGRVVGSGDASWDDGFEDEGGLQLLAEAPEDAVRARAAFAAAEAESIAGKESTLYSSSSSSSSGTTTTMALDGVLRPLFAPAGPSGQPRASAGTDTSNGDTARTRTAHTVGAANIGGATPTSSPRKHLRVGEGSSTPPSQPPSQSQPHQHLHSHSQPVPMSLPPMSLPSMSLPPISAHNLSSPSARSPHASRPSRSHPHRLRLRQALYGNTRATAAGTIDPFLATATGAADQDAWKRRRRRHPSRSRSPGRRRPPPPSPRSLRSSPPPTDAATAATAVARGVWREGEGPSREGKGAGSRRTAAETELEAGAEVVAEAEAEAEVDGGSGAPALVSYYDDSD